MDQSLFDAFFEPYAKNVDQADSISSFWRLSDAIILEIITNTLGDLCTTDSVICDAGGGTGRWVKKMSERLPCCFMIYDRSVDMLAKARENIKHHNLSDRVSIIQGDLVNMKAIPDNSIDHIVSIYSPISFIYEPLNAARELHRVLKRGGKIIIMGHSFYNALASKINNYRAGIDEIEQLAKNYRVKWASHVPELVTYSKDSMETLLSQAEFKIEKTFGVPVFVQPGPEDFDPENRQTSAISLYLDDPDIFKKIFDLEIKHNSRPTVADRGMNIFTVATKE